MCSCPPPRRERVVCVSQCPKRPTGPSRERKNKRLHTDRPRCLLIDPDAAGVLPEGPPRARWTAVCSGFLARRRASRGEPPSAAPTCLDFHFLLPGSSLRLPWACPGSLETAVTPAAHGTGENRSPRTPRGHSQQEPGHSPKPRSCHLHDCVPSGSRRIGNLISISTPPRAFSPNTWSEPHGVCVCTLRGECPFLAIFQAAGVIFGPMEASPPAPAPTC